VCGAIAGTWLALAAGAAGAQGVSATVTDRLNGYFDRPNAPETFRALTGPGDPGIAADNGETEWFSLKDGPDAAAYKRLFPEVGDQSSVYPGDCRLPYAIEVLKARIAALGPDHPYVRRWIETQRAVFAACLQDRPAGAPTALPPPLAIQDTALAKLQADDRAYQAASLSFYNGANDAALAAFSKIARSDSVHRAAAIYMRVAIRAGTHKGYRPGKPIVPPAQSIREVEAILADPSLASIHAISRELLGWIAYTVADDATRRVQVQATLADLESPAARLAADPEARRRYALARSDIDFLHQWSPQGAPDWWLAAGPPPDFTASRAMMDAAKTDPLAAWVLFPPPYAQGHAWAPFASGGATGWSPLEDYAKTASAAETPAGFAWTRVQHAISRTYDAALWAQVHDETVQAGKGDQRAIAALSFDFYHQVRLALSAWREPSDSDPASLTTAIEQLKAFPFKDSEPYAAARHDGLQYLMSVGRIADARRWRDQIPPASPDNPSYDNAPLLQILAEDAPHFAAALGAGDSSSTLALQNNLSIPALRSLATRADVPMVLRAKFARLAWARTYALGRPVNGDLDQLMRTLNPTMTQGWVAKPGRTVRPNDRHALLDVLRSSAINILIVDTDRDPQTGPPDSSYPSPGLTGLDLFNHDDDNWWCAWARGRNRRDLQVFVKQAFFDEAGLSKVDGETAYDLHDKLAPMLAQSFAFKSQDPTEIDALTRIPCAPDLLTHRVLDWVQHPGWFETRQGQAEALALAVKTTRYGCYSDGPHSAYSKAAWRLLHQRFPTTEWAIKTKYWFSCVSGDKDCPAREDD
jgi:hypothetical protein